MTTPHRCHYCNRELKIAYEVPVGRVDPVLGEVCEPRYVGRECLKKAAAEGYDNPQRVSA